MQIYNNIRVAVGRNVKNIFEISDIITNIAPLKNLFT